MIRCALLILLVIGLYSSLFGLTLGQDSDESFIHYPSNNIYIDHDDSQMYFNGDSKYIVYRQLSAGILKGHGLAPAEYVDYGLNGAYKFVKTKDENISFAVAYPSNYDRTVTSNIRIGFSTSATTGEVKFQINYSHYGLNDDVSTSNAEHTITVTANASATGGGYAYAYADIVNPDSNDKMIIFEIKRLASQDTVLTDVYVTGVSIIYYANKLGG